MARPNFLIASKVTYEARCLASILEAMGAEVRGPVDCDRAHRMASPFYDGAVLVYEGSYMPALLVACALRDEKVPFIVVGVADPSDIADGEHALPLPASYGDVRRAIELGFPAAVTERMDLSRRSDFLPPDLVLGARTSAASCTWNR